MSETCTPQPTVVRNERGLSINGTRVTLYRLMGLIHAGQSPEEIREWLSLTEQQVTDALEYIEVHRTEVEAEYELVLNLGVLGSFVFLAYLIWRVPVGRMHSGWSVVARGALTMLLILGQSAVLGKVCGLWNV